jgi:stage II sporulation protein D
MGVDSRFWVRVLLLNDATACMIEAGSPLHLGSAGGPLLGRTSVPVPVRLVGGQLQLGATPRHDDDVLLSPEQPHIFRLDGKEYRGRLRLIVNPDGQSFDAVNLVPLEPYLAGVVGREMHDCWEPPALQAQAIAARTYCLFTKNRFGVNRHYDVRRTQASQVYDGVAAESAPVWDAVNRTCGQVLIELDGQRADRSSASRAGAPPWWTAAWNPDAGSENETLPSPATGRGCNLPRCSLFPAYYSSTCGGHTSSSEEAFGVSYGPLQGVACPYCRDVARPEIFYWPTATFDRETITKQLLGRYPNLAALGEITDITVMAERSFGSFSRFERIRLTGSTGKTDTLRGEDLRLALDPSGRKIRSAACRIVPWGTGWAFVSGQGWGHGVGMCQHGAQGMARLGHEAQSILQYYYSGAQIVNVY